MLRFILKRDGLDGAGRRWDYLETLDVDLPELERLLSRGGFGNGEWDQTHLVGVELNPRPTSGGAS